MVEKVALEHEKVKAEIAKLKLPEGTVVCADPWIYGKSTQLPSALIFRTWHHSSSGLMRPYLTVQNSMERLAP